MHLDKEAVKLRIVWAGSGCNLPDHHVNNEQMVELFKQHGKTHTESGKELTAEGIEKLIGVQERRLGSARSKHR